MPRNAITNEKIDCHRFPNATTRGFTISRTPPSMADDEPAAKRAKNESDEEPEESEDPLDDEDDEEIIIDGETFNVDDLEEESDDEEEESDDDDDDDGSDEEDEEDEEDDISDVLGGNVYVVTHHQESKSKESLNNPDLIRKMDCEIVGVAGSLEKAEDVAREYTEGQFEVEVNEDFHGRFADGFEVPEEESNDIVHKVMIEVHEMKD